MLKLLYLLHVFATVVWVGGMFFAHFVLRPVAVAQLPPPQRLPFWVGIFKRFFPWVWVCVIGLLLTGQAMILQMGGMGAVGMQVHIMVAIGYVMAGIFAYLYFEPYASLKRAVAAQDWPAGGAAQDRIRKLVVTNLTLGLLNIALVFVLPVLL
ncbi:MAG: DUF4149 domain-containing protein [Hydrogenophilales bacterium]|nr:DUF4149 domain-containing protein [Hydrogenophilales bacterium]